MTSSAVVVADAVEDVVVDEVAAGVVVAAHPAVALVPLLVLILVTGIATCKCSCKVLICFMYFSPRISVGSRNVCQEKMCSLGWCAGVMSIQD